ncbi:monocarboxylate transporter 2 [Apiospora hydei]|uniref:Monocarboxylate transporter 2 n=1 Tax=Apiospora hydei TaxID=1337664 RepID=A0ABR1VJG0_9PEZI
MPLVQQRLQRWRRPMVWAGCACLSVCLGTFLLYFIARMFMREGERYIPPAYIGDANSTVLNESICTTGLARGSFATAFEVPYPYLRALWMVRASSWFYYPILGMVNEYWTSRAAAWRTAHCAVVHQGLSGRRYAPFVLQALLAPYGYQTTAARRRHRALLVCPRPSAPNVQIKGWAIVDQSPRLWGLLRRQPSSGAWSTSSRPCTHRHPHHPSSLGLDNRTAGALLLALMSVSQAVSQFIFGLLPVVAGTIAAGPLVCFAIVYSFFGADFTALWVRMNSAIADDGTAAPGAFSLLNFGKGFWDVLARPVGEVLVGRLSPTTSRGRYLMDGLSCLL